MSNVVSNKPMKDINSMDDLTGMKDTTVIIVDDHPLFRQGVADTLSLEPNLRVVGLASSGEEGLDLIREIRPDIAILDVNLPGINGQQVTRQVIADAHLAPNSLRRLRTKNPCHAGWRSGLLYQRCPARKIS
jgi:CheY-like chemotaxis protein